MRKKWLSNRMCCFTKVIYIYSIMYTEKERLSQLFAK